MTTYIDVHAIQSLPPSNINRDESGAPKSAVYGGTLRARVSSQSWKRAMRQAFDKQNLVDAENRGTRTLRVVEELTRRIQALGDLDAAEAAQRATAVLNKAGIKIKEPRVKKGETPDPAKYVSEALLFLSGYQLDKLAQLAASGEEVSAKDAKAAADQENGIEVSLFGRMVASTPDLTVDAAVQVAHAISTHTIDPQADFYTAVDDFVKGDEEDAGAGMMGTIEFNSSTLYRFATINVDGLEANLEDPEVTARAAAAFVEAFITSMPTGKQNSLSAQTLPDAVLVQVRHDRPVSLVGAFERPIAASDNGFVEASVAAMLQKERSLATAFDTEADQSWLIFEGPVSDDVANGAERVTKKQLVANVEAATRRALQGEGA